MSSSPLLPQRQSNVYGNHVQGKKFRNLHETTEAMGFKRSIFYYYTQIFGILADNPELFWLLKPKMASTPGTDYQKGWQPWMSITTIVFFPIFRCRYIYRIVTPIYFALIFFFTLEKRGKNCGQSRMSIHIQNGNTTIVYFFFFF